MENNYQNLISNLKRFVNLFFQEYSKYLDKDQLEIIKNIDYEHIIHINSSNYPLGMISYNQIFFSDSTDVLIETMKKMDNYGKGNNKINNTNFTSYLKYVCENGYDSYSYYMDQLLYLIFQLVRYDNSGLNNGFINYEIRYLSIKHRLRIPNIYRREEALAEKFIKLIGHENLLNIMFKSHIDGYIYLKDHLGYRYAELYDNVSNLVNESYQKLSEKDYSGFQGYVDYARDYDSIGYGDVYNCILEFNAKEMQ